MGFADTLKGAMDNQREFELSREMSLEEIMELIKGSGLPAEITGSFDLKKGLGGKKIEFKAGKASANLTVKGTKAKLSRVQQGGSGVSVGGVAVGGMKKALEKNQAENLFFSALGDALKDVLK